MGIDADFTIDYVNKRIRRADSPGSTDVYLVNDLYSWLQNVFDDLDQMDDDVPMSAQTPTEYTLVNGWIVLEECIPFLKQGAIQTVGWNASTYAYGIRVFEFLASGYVSAVTGDIGREVGYSGGTPTDTGTLLAYDNTLRKWWVRVDDTGDTFSNTATAIDLDDGAGTGAGTLNKASITGENLWANIYTLGTIADTPYAQVYAYQADEPLTEWWPEDRASGGHIDALIKVKEAGTFIDGGNITVFCRHYQDTFDHFPIDLSSGGRNAVPLATSVDINNTTAELYLSLQESDLSGLTVGLFVRGETSNAYGEIISVDDTNDYVYLGNVKGTFQTSETIAETTDGTAAGDTTSDYTNDAATAYTNVVAGYGGAGKIMLYTVNGEVDVDTTTGTEPALLETFTGGTYSATGVVLDITVSGTWGSGGTATIVVGNMTGGVADGETLTFSGGGTAAVNDTHGIDQTVVTVDKAYSQQTAYTYNMVADLNGDTVADFYEYLKYVTREDASFNIYSYNSGIRLITFVSGGYVNCVEGDIGLQVLGGTTGDTGTLLAYDNGNRIWTVKMDSCTGTPASDDLFDQAETVEVTTAGGTGTGTTIGASVPSPQLGEEYIQAMPQYAPLKASPLGTFAGGTYFGARGIWIEDMDSGDANSYQLVDATNTTRTPPVSVPVKVTGLETGDRAAVFPTTGDNFTIDKNQYDMVAQSGSVAYVNVDVSGGDIPNDTPADGTIIVVRRDSGGNILGEDRYTYTAWDNDNSPVYGTFTISGVTSSAYDTDDTAYVPYAFGISIADGDVQESVQYVSDRWVMARVRQIGILPFQTKGKIQNTGYTATAIRTEDTIVVYTTTTTT